MISLNLRERLHQKNLLIMQTTRKRTVSAKKWHFSTQNSTNLCREIRWTLCSRPKHTHRPSRSSRKRNRRRCLSSLQRSFNNLRSLSNSKHNNKKKKASQVTKQATGQSGTRPWSSLLDASTPTTPLFLETTIQVFGSLEQGSKRLRILYSITLLTFCYFKLEEISY